MAYKNSHYLDKAFLESENESLMAGYKRMSHLLGRVLYMYTMRNTSAAMTEESVSALMNDIRKALAR